MEKKQKKEQGITLIALIITIIILLILAGISIAALTQTGLFSRAKQAEQVSKEKQKEENTTLETYENEIDKYLGENNGETSSESKEIKLVDKIKDGTIKIGDYVKYTPDELKNDTLQTLKDNLKNYSGKSDSTINSEIDRENLSWRVLDVTKEENVRLISATPTTKMIELYGYNGYNNAVKLIDDTCSMLYTNKKLASKIQNIKVEDIQDKMVENDYKNIDSNYGKRFTPTYKYYPSILLKEKNQKVTVDSNTTIGTELGLSEQKDLINQLNKLQADTLDVEYTYWNKKMTVNDFYGDNKEIYFKLFINNNGETDTENYYSDYWISSRCIYIPSTGAGFHVRDVEAGTISTLGLFGSFGDEYPEVCTFRPIITLNSNVQIDTPNSGNGSTAAQGYAIK